MADLSKHEESLKSLYLFYDDAYDHQNWHGLPPIKSITLVTRGLTRSRDKLEALYLQYQNAYSYQIWQGCNLP